MNKIQQQPANMRCRIGAWAGKLLPSEPTSGHSTSGQSTSLRPMRFTLPALNYAAPVLAILGSLVIAPAVQADERSVDPTVLLNQMSESLKTLNYSGVFVHMHDGNVETMKIMHAHDRNGIRERLISLNGEAREVFRNNKLVTCIWPGSQSVIVSKSKPRDLFPKVNKTFTQSEFYEFSMAEEDRVAGINAYVVEVSPRDNFRYGYRFWIDKKTNMLLRSMLTDEDNRSLEQVMFTAITYPEKFSEGELDARADSRGGYTWVDHTKKSDDADNISFAALPGGYKEVSETYHAMPMSDNSYSHVMLSDGMASVSIYVEYLKTGSADNSNSGVSRMGAVNAYGRSIGNSFVTVVGEVPVETVKAIGDSVAIVSPVEK